MAPPRPPQIYWPKFESAFLAEIVTTFRKNRKWLARSVDTYSCERLRERTGGVVVEKLEMSFDSVAAPPVEVSFNCWDDRLLWLELRQAAETGAEFEWRHEGRVGAAGPAAVASLLMDSLDLSPDANRAYALDFLNEHWAQVAFTGPVGAVK